MTKRSFWKTIEIPCAPGEAGALWDRWREKGAAGAATSRGSGILHRDFLRVFWPLEDAGEADLCEEDWTGHWKEAFTGFRVTKTITVAPAWEAREPGEGETVIYIDPGMAFGAGDHPTTRLCIRILENILQDVQFEGGILDAGAGTGVLSIAAAKLGAKKITALDIDPFCFASAERNVKTNRAGNEVTPVLLSLDLLPGSYGLVMANIVAGQLKSLAGEIKSRLAPGGLLLLSGFETAALPSIEEAFAPLEKIIVTEEEGWVAALFKAGA
ncbi:methyltransferase domain-containing protein [bacterium]|nr:MAG: methyltransferase domain-containing protein [bacterium]